MHKYRITNRELIRALRRGGKSREGDFFSQLDTMSDQMNDDHSRNHLNPNDHESKPLKYLGRSQIEMIDEALEAVAPFGEFELIVEKGRLRFVVTKNGHDALNWHPDSIGGQETDAPAVEHRPKTPGQSP